jgi:hypothetical protein
MLAAAGVECRAACPFDGDYGAGATVYDVTEPLTWVLFRMRRTLHFEPSGIDCR